MGSVFSAVDETTGAEVAIKWVRPGREHERTRERLLREWALARQIEHPNVVRQFGAGEQDGSAYLVMELLVGEPLEQWVLRGPFDPGLAAQLMMPILRGVAAAHDAGIVHRDIKPSNVILCREEGGVRPTVFDFGISRGARTGVTGDQQLTQHGVMVGTPLYMAPEQLVGTQEADIRADVYALGVILYELLSGEVPFESELGSPELLTEKIDRPAIRLSEYLVDVDPELDAVLARALERSPAKRFGSVKELGEALEPFCTARFSDDAPVYGGPSPIENRGATLRVRRRRRRRQRPWLLLLAAALVVAVALVSGVIGFGGNDEPAPASTARPAQTPTAPVDPRAPGPPASEPAAARPSVGAEAPPEVAPVARVDPEPAPTPPASAAAPPVPSVPAARTDTGPRPHPTRRVHRRLPSRIGRGRRHRPRRRRRRHGRSGSLSVDDF